MRLPDPFADRYTNLRFVGRGGFGVVYRAWDLEMERDIALKLLNPELAADGDWKKRFRQEATAASKFTHPNITIVFDRGEYQSQPFIVMELVEGEPLSRVIEQRTPLTDTERLFLIEQLCDGLHYAHQRNIVHRDIKPVNLIVREDHDGTQLVRTLKILDFGIAKSVNTGQTSTGQMMFTPNYVSPEQIRGDEVDRRSDMFAVGAVAYELLTYEKAFAITSTNPFSILDEVRKKIAEQPHRPMTAVRSDIDTELSEVVDRALAKRPEERFRDLAEMRRHLHRIYERLKEAEPRDTTIVLNPKQQAAVKRAREALEADDPTAAISHFQEALASASNQVVRRFIEQELEDAQEKQITKRAEQRARDEEAAREAIASASAAFGSGDATVAIRMLEQFEPADLVADARDELTLAAALIRRAERVIAQGSTDDREAVLRELDQFSPADLVKAPLERLRARSQAAERAAADRAQAAIVSARAAFVAGTREEAIRSLEQFAEPHRVTRALDTLREANRVIEAASGSFRSAERRQRVKAFETLAAFADRELVASTVEELRRIDKQLRETEDHNRAATILSEAARKQFEDGDRSGALRSLEQFAPPHALVTAALTELSERARQLEEQEARERQAAIERQAALERQAAIERKAAQERQAALERQALLEQSAEKAIARATKLFASGGRTEAIEDLQRFSPPELVAEALRQMEQLAALIVRAEERVRTGTAAERRAAIERLSRVVPEHLTRTPLAALRELDAELTAVESRREKERARAALVEEATAIQKRAHDLFVQGAVDDALGLLNAFGAPDLVAATRATLQAAAQEIQTARAAVAREPAFIRRTTIERLERRKPAELFARAVAQLRQVDLERTAEEERAEAERLAAAADRASQAARQQFARGEHEAALKALESFMPVHPAATRTLEELRAEYERILEARRAKEEEERKRAEAERAARRAKEEQERKRLEAERAAREAREEEERKRAEAEEAARRAKEIEDRKRAEAEQAARRAKEIEDRKRAEAEQAARRAKEIEDRKRAEAEQAARRAKEEEERKRLEAEEAARRAKEEQERKRAEAEQAAKAREVAALVAQADSAVGDERFEDAAGLLDRASKLLPDSADVAAARMRLTHAIEAIAERVKRQRIDEMLREIGADIHSGRFAAATEALKQVEALGAADAQLVPLRDRLASAQTEHAQVSSALAALKDAIATASAADKPASRIEVLDRALTGVLQRQPAASAALSLWRDYQDALRQAQELRKAAAIQEARSRIERELARRSVKNAERALREAETTLPELPIWKPLRGELEALRTARAAEPSLVDTALQQIRKVPVSIAAGLAALAIVATVLVIWHPWAGTELPPPPPETGGKTVPMTREESLFKEASSRVAAGQKNEAVKIALQSLSANPKYGPTLQLLERLRTDAATATTAARDKAVSANASSRSSFKAAEQKTSEAQGITDPLRTDEAVRTFETAAELYRSSETERFSAEEFLQAAQKERVADRTDTAVKYAIDGLEQYPRNDPLVSFLRSIRTEAIKQMAVAQQAAAKAGATAEKFKTMQSADERRRFALARSAPQQTPEALDALRDAEKLYRDAEKEAVDTRAAADAELARVAPFMKTAKEQIGRGDLVGAAGTLVKGLGTAPKNSDLLGVLQTVVTRAENDASAAKRSADAANVSSRPQYATAASRLQAAEKNRSGRPEDVASAIGNYTEAARLYREAAALGPVPPPPPPPPPIAETVSKARDLIRERNYSDATGAVLGVLPNAPKNPELLGVLREILDAAANDASAQRKLADAANAFSRPEYMNAVERVRSATKARDSGRPEDAESAVRDYVTAARLYRDAANRARTESPGPASSEAADKLAIQQLLRNYVTAYNSMDVRRVQQYKPAFKAYSPGLRSTVLTISNEQIVLNPNNQSASVTLTVQYRNDFGKSMPGGDNTRPQTVTWWVQRTPDGWVIVK